MPALRAPAQHGQGPLLRPALGQRLQRAATLPGPQRVHLPSVVLPPATTTARNAALRPPTPAAPRFRGPDNRNGSLQYTLATEPHVLPPAASREALARSVQLPCSDGPLARVGSPRCQGIVSLALGQYADDIVGGCF